MTTISIDTPDGAFSAYISAPRAERAPAVIVLQEIFGVNAFVKGACDWLAGEGYLAVAPDIFWRQQPNVSLTETDRDQAMKLMQGFDETRGVEDCARLLQHVRGMAQCTGKVGAVGYCLGGKIAYLMAARTSIDAAIAYYGVGIQKALNEASAVRAPLTLILGAEDGLCPPEAQAQILDAFARVDGVTCETFPGVGHAFARTGSTSYNAEASERANAMTRALFARHLQGAVV